MEQETNNISFCSIADIKVLDFKYKQNDLERLMMLEGSIKRFGQLRPVTVITIEGVLVAVEGRKILATMAHLGDVDVLIMELRRERGTPPALINIILNELQHETNYIELSREITLIEQHRNLLPFTPLELDKLKSIAEFDWTTLSRLDNPEQTSLFS